ncbi:MAG: hypothetical protein DI537_05270 [Stutzerimonas stutzeri]|nr:MAG: hypothetical protein DI537_05270 [Stutzerimonas stutzeri]
MTAEEVRLAYAARILDRLMEQEKYSVAFGVLNYVTKNCSEFGVRKPTIEERKQITALKHTGATFPYLDTIRRASILAIREAAWDLMITAEYTATILSEADTAPMTLVALAIADRYTHELLLNAASVNTGDDRTDAVPLFSVAIGAYPDAPRSTDCVKRDILASRDFIEAHLVEAGYLAKDGAATFARVGAPVATASNGSAEEALPINAVKLATKLTAALRGESALVFARVPEATIAPAQHTALEGLATTLKLARDRDVHGLHFAVRDKNPRHGIKTVHHFLAAAGTKPIVVMSTDASEVICEIIAHQINGILQTAGGPIPPILLADSFDLLGAHEDVQQLDIGIDDNAEGTIQQVFDTLAMTPQKNILRDKSDAFLSSVVWIIDDARPVSEELIGTLAEIVNLPTDELTEKANAVIAMGERHGFTIDDATSRSVAACVTNVEDIDGVIKLAALRGSTDDLVRHCRRLLAGSKTNQIIPVQPPDRFDLRYVRSPKSIPDFITKLVPLREKPIGILLHGEPGTSKTSVARHIAERMGMKVLSKKYSEISGWRVSDTEKGISRAFQQAVAEDAFLILDECDSFLRSRSLAMHQWEKSAVNEALTCIDNHPLPFACTTNYLKELDPAVLRRFRHKLELIGMDTDRARLAWANILGLAPEEFPEDGSLDNLTISDFALVAAQMGDLGERSAKFALNALAAEKADKTAKSSSPIGFLAQRI